MLSPNVCDMFVQMVGGLPAPSSSCLAACDAFAAADKLAVETYAQELLYLLTCMRTVGCICFTVY